ncbi:hypothetical protein AB0H12_35535 [Actinosynnema sp. NPDC023794]
MKVIAFAVRDRHRLGKYGGERVRLVLSMSVWKIHRMFSSRVMRSIAKRELRSCVVVART